MSSRAALFDLDGTLLDSLADIAGAMNFSLSQHGLPTHAADAYRIYVGAGVEQLVANAVPAAHPELHASVLKTYRACYAERLFDCTRPFPGIPEALEMLEREGFRLGVLSNKLHAPTQLLVERLLPRIPVAAVFGERSGVARKPDPAGALALARELGAPPARCAFVGDTPVDMETARSAGMFAVGVTWGFREGPLLEAHGAQALVEDAEALVEVLLEQIR